MQTNRSWAKDGELFRKKLDEISDQREKVLLGIERYVEQIKRDVTLAELPGTLMLINGLEDGVELLRALLSK